MRGVFLDRSTIDSSIDFSALQTVVDELAHAIVDVLESEPPDSNHQLVKMMFLITHHIAWGSLQAQQRLMDCVVENIRYEFPDSGY